MYRTNQYIKPKTDYKLIAKNMLKTLSGFWKRNSELIIALSVIGALVSMILGLFLYLMLKECVFCDEVEKQTIYRTNVTNYFGTMLSSDAKIKCTDDGSCVVMQDDWTVPQHLSCNKYSCTGK